MKKTLILVTILMFTACSKVGIEPIMKHQISENRQITQVITKKSQLKSNKLKKQILGSYALDGQNPKIYGINLIQILTSLKIIF